MPLVTADLQIANHTIIVGAGISFPRPTAFPLFNSVKQALIDGLGLGNALNTNVLAPETILYFLDAAGAPISAIIVELFRDGTPNAVHYALAAALRKGAFVWTTNVDEMIEAAATWSADDDCVFYGKTRTAHILSASLFKLHGTVCDPSSFAFRTPEVISPLPRSVRDRFTSTILGRDVIIAGYAGLDPDFRPALESTLPLAKTVIWYELPQLCSILEKRFAAVVRIGRLRILPSDNPSLSLLGNLKSMGCWEDRCASLAGQIIASVVPKPIDLTKWKLRQFNYAAGQLLEHLGASNSALFRYLAGTLALRSQKRRLCGTYLIGAGLYWRKAWAQPIRRLLALVVPVPGHLGWSNAVSLHSRLLEREGDYFGSFRFGIRALKSDRHDLGKMLDISAAARKAGKLRIALTFTTRVINKIDEGKPSDGVLAARALYEYAYALRLFGKSAEALAAAERLEGGLDFYGGPNWVGWAQCQKGCVLVQVTSRYDEGIEYLVKAQNTFLALGELHKAAAVATNIATAFRAKGALEESRRALSSAQSIRRKSLYRSVFEFEVIAIEEAELDRLEGHYGDARRRYELLLRARAPIHTILALLGLSEIAENAREGYQLATRALKMSRRIGFRFGEAHAVFTLANGHSKSRAESLKWINESGVFLFPVTVESMSAGSRALHNIAFPS